MNLFCVNVDVDPLARMQDEQVPFLQPNAVHRHRAVSEQVVFGNLPVEVGLDALVPVVDLPAHLKVGGFQQCRFEISNNPSANEV